ncbi:MAG: methyltransferase, TIGR04325 family, partial [Sulfurimonas sp.]|uniref:methyltransferase, TIGR04325 family n=1 Tax=Sulfurimonas sp. TaxID=2022749 RepID=UPI003D10F34A
YNSWDEAAKDAIGYDDKAILQKVRQSLLKVKNGEAVYERDSVLFDEIQYSWSLLAGLLYASAISNGTLKVLDFGGSLGSTYFQNKKFLDGLPNVSWSIVEQKHFVDIGKADFEDDRLKFYYNLENCITNESPNILILSSVLQYIKNWQALMDSILSFTFDIIIVDLTPFSLQHKELITVQKVSPDIYNAAYPCRIFDEHNFTKFFEKEYKLLETFQTMENLRIYLSNGNEAIYKGFIYQRKKND